MQKKNLILLVLAGIIGIAGANASSTVTITALKSPVWVQQNNKESELGRNSKLEIGDNIATGDAGRVEIQLWVNARLRLNSNSEITFRAAKKVDPVDTPEIIAGNKADTGELTAAEFEATGEEELPAYSIDSVDKSDAITQESRAAAPGTTPQDEVSGYIYTVYLFSTRAEEVAEQVNRRFQQAGHDTRILEGTSGSVLRYRVVAPGFESRQSAQNFSDAIMGTLGVTQAWIGKDKSFVARTAIAQDAAGESVEVVDSDNVASGETTAAQIEATLQNGESSYIYTVYLFSTRDEEVGEQVNRRFQQAGHDTRIVESKTGSVLRYRVVAPGFESRRAAQNFSDAIVGTLGVTQTWIGWDLQ